MKQIRKRLTYANVMSSIAVFLVLGGATAIAAKKIGTKDLKANAVKTGKIAKEAVKAGKIAKGAVLTDKLAQGAVLTDKLADNAVTGAKVDEATLGTVPDAAKLSGKGPASYESKVFLARDSSFVEMPQNVKTTLVTLDLPAGTYLIQGQVTLNNNGANTESPAGSCVLAAGATLESYEFPGLFGASGPGDRTNLAGQIVHTFEAAGQATLSCTPQWTAGNGFDPTISAISVQP